MYTHFLSISAKEFLKPCWTLTNSVTHAFKILSPIVEALKIQSILLIRIVCSALVVLPSLIAIFIHDSHFCSVFHPFLHTHRHIAGTHGGCWRIWNTFSHILDKCKFLSSNTPYLSILVHQWTIQACKKNTKNA